MARIAPERLQKLIPTAPAPASFDPTATGNDKITFSQLSRATHDYFSDLEGCGPSAVSERVQKMEFRGQFFGCRAVRAACWHTWRSALPYACSCTPLVLQVGMGPASKTHQSAKDFLAHHDLPHDLINNDSLVPRGAQRRSSRAAPHGMGGYISTGKRGDDTSSSATKTNPDWHVASHSTLCVHLPTRLGWVFTFCW